MRAIVLIAAAALALSACRDNKQSENGVVADQELTAQDIVVNDVTAIDAVTGDAADMAADVNYLETENLVGNEAGNAQEAAPRRRPSGDRQRRTPPARSARPAAEQPEPETEPAPAPANDTTQ